MGIRVEKSINAHRRQVWLELADLANHDSWMKDAVEIEFLGTKQAGIGTRMRVPTRVGPFRTTDIIEVTGWVDGESISGNWTLRVSDAQDIDIGPVDVHVRTGVVDVLEPTGAMTHVHLRVNGETVRVLESGGGSVREGERVEVGGCELTVSGTIYFSGTLEGAAPGTNDEIARAVRDSADGSRMSMGTPEASVQMPESRTQNHPKRTASAPAKATPAGTATTKGAPALNATAAA